MFHLIFLIFGDIVTLILVAFYSGVGILQSAGIVNISRMILPCIALWILLACFFGIYRPLESFRELSKNLSLSSLIQIQKPFPFFFACFLSMLGTVVWISCYWRYVLNVENYFRLSPGLLVWFFSASAAFFLFWRCLWCVLVWFAASASRRRIILILLIDAVIVGVVLILVHRQYSPQMFTLSNVPEDTPRTALVFGAGTYRNGTASRVLRDRMETAIALYDAGLIDEMILSGDNVQGIEVDVMESLALEAGVPKERIIRDEDGTSTLLSVEHAKKRWGKEAVTAVSQHFHLTRILINCAHLDLKATAVSADLHPYNYFSWMTWYLRDWAGTLIMLVSPYAGESMQEY